MNDEIAEFLKQDSTLVAEVARRLLDEHFPSSLHEDILDAVGLNLTLTESVRRNKRDPEFRVRVLTAYEYACAVRGFDVRLGNQTLGLEAAHIKWHQAGGPDEEKNGLALCSLHHKAFDLGAFNIQSSRVLLVSEQAYGRWGFNELLLTFHGKRIRNPLREAYLPSERFLKWHERQVFKRPARELNRVHGTISFVRGNPQSETLGAEKPGAPERGPHSPKGPNAVHQAHLSAFPDQAEQETARKKKKRRN